MSPPCKKKGELLWPTLQPFTQNGRMWIVVPINDWYMTPLVLSNVFGGGITQEPLQGILSIPTHVFATFVQINHFCNFWYNCPPWHLVKLINIYRNNYKMVCSCICNLYLWLMLIWMKMKNTLISSILMASQNRWKCNSFCNLGGGSRAMIPRGIFSTWFATIKFSHKCTCNQMWKRIELVNEIIRFNGLIIFLNFFQWINH
jgi:hypothetical protein